MENLRVCRVCLITDVKMLDLRSYPLSTFLESISSLNAFNTMGLPSYACVECATHIQKYYHFQTKCVRGQTALYDIIKSNGLITMNTIKQIDRKALNLASTLSKVKQETILNYEDMAEIKEEPYDLDLVFEKDANYEEIIELKQEPPKAVSNDNLNFEIDSVKNESFNDCLPSLSSDDDEPLILRKSENDKKRRKRNSEAILDLSVEDEELKAEETYFVENTLPADSEYNNVTKRKRGRPRKNAPKPRIFTKTKKIDDVDDQNIEDFCTVITLTLQEQMEEITNRKTSSNYVNCVYQCDYCYKGFIDTHAWENHKSKHDPSAGDVECPICKFRFKNKRQLQKHASNHEKKYACKSCSYVSKTPTQAKQHQRWHKGYTYQCQYCDEVSAKWTSHLSHVRMKHPSQFICSICGYSFVSKLGLTMHKTMMHKDVNNTEGADAGPYCEVCDVKFISETAYKRHMVSSSKHSQSLDRNGCKVCGESFNTLDMLKIHNRQEHSKKRPKNYGKKPSILKWPTKCEHCSEEIQNARDYWTHFRRVHPDKNYPIQKNYICDICGKSFRGNAFLMYHKRTHTEERAYKCSICSKAFHNRTNLHTHMKTHSDHRPYPCDVCYKAFKCKGALDRHYRCHTGEKPYECEVCGKSFGQSNSRKLHVKTVHLKQPAPYISRNRLIKKNKPKDETIPTQFVML